MVNYSQAKVYKIVDNTNGNIYVGSTCEPTLARRLAGHVTNYKSYLNGKGNNITSFQILENNDYDIVLIENCDGVTSRDELFARERDHIETLTCVNKVIPLRTHKEYREDNRDIILQKKKDYYEANKDVLAEKDKAYYIANKDKELKRHKIYRDAHKEQTSETSKKYYEANKEALVDKMKAYQDANKDKLRAYRKEYYAKKRQSKEEQVEATEQ
jgi:hypothetical protein